MEEYYKKCRILKHGAKMLRRKTWMDNEYYIVKVDIGSKQKYIFRSNVLKEIIGASEVIKFVTEDLGDQILKYMNENQEQFNKIENYMRQIMDIGYLQLAEMQCTYLMTIKKLKNLIKFLAKLLWNILMVLSC